MRHARFTKLWSPAVAVAAAAVISTSGCTTTETETVTTTTRTGPAVSSPSDRVVMSTNGRWELRGDGRTTPYFWVWIPAGVTTVSPVPAPPPLPR